MNFEHGRSTVVETDKGYIRGFKNDGIYHFYGIKYAHAQRFSEPVEVDKWDGVIDAVNYGFISHPFRPYKIGNNLKNPHRFWPEDDDCQNLNVWTKHINDDTKKPVVVWFHGGGFFNGSAVEQAAYDGFNLCKYGDAVVVTVNHRLNIFGYLDLSSFSDKYLHSANVGNLDLIAALKWVNRNIGRFGGDSSNVTIFGQSGGGAKVISVMNMAKADGLYSKAMIMSGTLGRHMTDEGHNMLPVTKGMLEILGISESHVEELENLDHRVIADAYYEAYKKQGGQGMPWIGPSKNCDYHGDPMYTGFSDNAKKIPVIIGSVYSEFFTLPDKYKRYAMSEKEMADAIENEFGKENADVLIPLYKKAFPNNKLIDMLTYDCAIVRGDAKDYVRKRIVDGCTDTYNYFFKPVFGINEGQTALHSSDIPFIFHNTDKVPSSDLGEATANLEKEMSMRFINFAATGTPQFENGIPWTKCEEGKIYTMEYDRQISEKCNYDDELFARLSKLKSFSFTKFMG